MSGTWIKTFNNKTIEKGSDLLIDQGKASWSKGCLDNIKEVFISDGLFAAILDIPDTEWHQFDRYRFFIGENKNIRIARVLQARLTEEHVNSYLCYNNEDIHLVWICLRNKPVGAFSYKISEFDINKWMSIQLSCSNNFSIFLGQKGNICGEQLFK